MQKYSLFINNLIFKGCQKNVWPISSNYRIILFSKNVRVFLLHLVFFLFSYLKKNRPDFFPVEFSVNISVPSSSKKNLFRYMM